MVGEIIIHSQTSMMQLLTYDITEYVITYPCWD